jgi:hypothetical protein
MGNTLSRWKLRVANNCLFVDETESGRIVLQHNARPGMRPYIHPLRGPDGQACLTEDSPWHHPWQHGIQTGFHGVNGCDFWFDPGQSAKAVIGTIEPATPNILDDDPPKWSVEAKWRHADGSALLDETQTWSLRDDENMLFLDLTWEMKAIPDVHIDQGSYGGFFVRMPFRSDRGASVISATGLKNDETEQQASVWVDLRMPVNKGDFTGGIAFLDHSDNPGHPAHWRVDGQRGINPAPCIPGAIDLTAGETMCHRYRLILHDGDLDPMRIQGLWDGYAKE